MLQDAPRPPSDDVSYLKKEIAFRYLVLGNQLFEFIEDCERKSSHVQTEMSDIDAVVVDPPSHDELVQEYERIKEQLDFMDSYTYDMVNQVMEEEKQLE